MALSILQWFIFVSNLLIIDVVFNGFIAWREWYKKESVDLQALPCYLMLLLFLLFFPHPSGNYQSAYPIYGFLSYSIMEQGRIFC